MYAAMREELCLIKRASALRGALLGGVGGAGLGALVDKENRGRGALLGAALGGAGGAGVGRLLRSGKAVSKAAPSVSKAAPAAPAGPSHADRQAMYEQMFA
jgi:hypothetical protein